jgi:hypothetical protein
MGVLAWQITTVELLIKWLLHMGVVKALFYNYHPGGMVNVLPPCFC